MAATEATNIVDVQDEEAFNQILSSTPPSELVVIFFTASWAPPCEQMRTILSTIVDQYPKPTPFKVVAVDAEGCIELSEKYDVTAVPFCAFHLGDKEIPSVSGLDATKLRQVVETYVGRPGAAQNGKMEIPPALTTTPRPQQEKNDGQTTTNGTSSSGVKNLSSYAPDSTDPPTAPSMSANAPKTMDPNPTSANPSEDDLHERLSGLVKAAPVMLFMKGTPSSPQCGFSRQLVSILRENGVKYGFFNILADDEVRQGMKTFADWPTFPQLWVGGELVGGLDIVSFSHFSASLAAVRAYCHDCLHLEESQR